MQLVTGRTLREIAPALDLREKVRLLEVVAQAMSAAHRLGVIHRDLKPGNILVERADDGSYFPYVVDFGLAARTLDLGGSGSGGTGGTAPYMAPEQVHGSAPLDRRTDVYGLGATLYHLLSGRPPLSGENGRRVRERILEERPVPLRQLDPRLPRDLEDIVARCLEKEPSRRYDSARALADDLGRFLDGEPLLARASSWRHRIRSRLRKHRLLVLVLAGAVAAMGGLAGAALTERWRAQRLVAIAAELGREITQDELSMRLAYLEPVHDIRRDRAQVRRRLHGLDEQVRRLGRFAIGPGHYARGRANLALGNPRAALTELEAAWGHGQRGPEVSAALGRARSLIYEQELTEVWRQADPEIRQDRLAELSRKLREPALVDLRAGSDGPSGEPLVITAEIAYLERRFDEVRRLAARILERDPGRFEAHRLVGKVELSMARELYHEGRHTQAEARLAAAEQSLRAALNVARCHPPSHEDLCEVQSLRVFLSRVLPGKGNEQLAFERAVAACSTASAVDPESGRAELLLALTYYRKAQNAIEAGADPRASLALALAGGRRALGIVTLQGGRSGTIHELLALASTLLAEYQDAHGIESQAALDEAIASARLAALASPNDVARRRSLALAWYQQAQKDSAQGRDPRPALDEVIRTARRATELAPRDYDHFNDLACAYGLRAEYERQHGGDPEESLRLGIESGFEAISRDPEDPFPSATLADLLADRAEHHLAQGRDPAEDLQKARMIAERAITIQPDWPDGYIALGRVLGLSARRSLKRGLSPAKDFSAARALLDRGMHIGPAEDEAYVLATGLLLEEAAWLERVRRSPLAKLAAARQTARTGLAKNPGRAELHRMLAEGAVREARIRKRPDLITESALPALRDALLRNPGDARIHLAYSEAYLNLATLLQAQRRPAAGWLEQARTAAARALAIHPGAAVSPALRTP
jgi:serine/threonine-protein kinase